MVDKLKESEMEQIIKHFERFERTDLMKDVLMGRTSFEAEAVEFYDLQANEIYLRGAKVRRYSLKDGMKERRIPEELILIVDVFGKKKLDANRLDYHGVRNDFEEHFTNKGLLKAILHPVKALTSRGNHEFDEFQSLIKKCREADYFARNNYKNHLIEKYFMISQD